MHEMALMSEIINIVCDDASVNGIRKVKKIEIIVGGLSNVLPEALELAFLYFRNEKENLLEERAQLHIILEEIKAKCRTCLLEFEPDHRIALCPNCQLPNSQIISGETFRVQSYEGSDKHES